MHTAHQSQAHTPQVTATARQHSPASPEAPQQKNTELPTLQRDLGNRYLQMAAAGNDASPEGDVEDCPDCAQQQVQTKLFMGQKGDPYEVEADRVAEQVLQMPDARAQRREFTGQPVIQHKPLVQGHTGGGSSGFREAPNIAPEALSSSGQPLDSLTRANLEPRFSHDFSRVRVHTDASAWTLNQRLHARAFTVGSDIYFGQGQYEPGSTGGLKLLAHELTHTIQQGASGEMLQGDFSIEPTTPNRAVPVLTAQQIQAAITFNQARLTDVTELEEMRDILGISRAPAVVDEDFVNAVVRYQAQFGLPADGRLGHATADKLGREIRAEADFLGPGNLGTLDPEFDLANAIRTMITANNTTYADYKAAIQASTLVKQHVALLDQTLLTDLKGQLSWNNFARCVELLGRQAPTGDEILRDSTMRATFNAAWTASTPGITRWDTPTPGSALAAACNPIPGAAAPAAHEEGGWVYLNLITGDLSTRRAAAGAQAGINVNVGAPTVTDAVMVATFHTHPNVGACWGAVTPSPADTTNAGNRGLPTLIQGAFPALADIARVTTGPGRRRHLAGNRLAPGAAGGLSPQARVDGTTDDE